MANAIETQSITKKYGKKVVVNHVSLNIPNGSVYGLVGENGSGKTTIMRLITGLAIPTSGKYSLFGISCDDKKIYKAKEKLAAIVEAPSLIPTMNAYDNLKYAAGYLGISINEDRINEILSLVGLNNVEKKLVKNFSLGMRQRLGIGLCLLNDPKMLILDEPMNGLDPEGIAQLRDLIIDLNKTKNITFLISSHILSELEKVATCFGIISHGMLLKEITTEELHDECRNSIDIDVDNIEKSIEILKKEQIDDYRIINHTIRIFDKVDSSHINKLLVENGINVSRLIQIDETIEEYYLNLMKGAN